MQDLSLWGKATALVIELRDDFGCKVLAKVRPVEECRENCVWGSHLEGVSPIVTTATPKKNHGPTRVNEISDKPLGNPELAKLIGDLSTSTDDASDLVRGLLQESINAGLQAEMDDHPD